MYDHDDNGRLAAATDWNTTTSTFAYDADGNVTEITHPATADTMVYDRAGRLESIVYADSLGPLAAMDYSRDDNGQLAAEDLTSLPGIDRTWGYDQLNQLTDENSTTVWHYDDGDNLATTASGLEQVFNEANQLCSSAPTVGTCLTPPAAATTFAYDTRGNRTSADPDSGPTTTYSYDQANRLVGVDTADATYGYTSDGVRTARTIGADSTGFVWARNGSLPLLLQETTGSDTTYYLYGPGGSPYAQINPDGSTTYLHHDQLGSVRLLTDETGGITGSATYDAYGTPSTTGTTSAFGYTGEYMDAESGLLYLRARHYDPTTGQFLTRDPLVSVTREAYGYAANNPINMIDPTGLGWGPIGDAWDATGGKAVTWVAENPGTAATIVGVGVCVVGTLGACGGAAAGAFAVRATERIVDNGFRDSLGANLADAGITYATFGLVSAPASLGLTRGGGAAIPGLLGAGERGIMASSPFWQQALSRFLAATPDLAGLFGGWWFDPARGMEC